MSDPLPDLLADALRRVGLPLRDYRQEPSYQERFPDWTAASTSLRRIVAVLTAEGET